MTHREKHAGTPLARLLPLALTVPLVASGCSSSSPDTQHSATSKSTGEVEISLMSRGQYDIELLVAADVESKMHVDLGDDVVTTPILDANFGVDVGGEPLSLDGYVLRIGAREFGSFAPDSSIEVRADGVYVDGDKRGDL